MVTSRKTHRSRHQLRLTFLPIEAQTLCLQGTTILDAARNSGIYIESACGGSGRCGKCRVMVMEGQVGPWTDAESTLLSGAERENGRRLACQATVLTEAKIFIDCSVAYGGPEKEKTFRQTPVKINPAVQYPKPSQATGNSTDRLLGAAFDIGTTTIALYLCDLTDGKILGSAAITNPQIAFGADVISRLAWAVRNPDDGAKLRAELIDALNFLIQDLTRRVGHRSEDIGDITVVGNTVMHHIFLGLDLSGLSKAPFTPALKQSVDVTAAAVVLEVQDGAHVHVLPIQDGFVGADSVATVISEEPYLSDDYTLIMDLGTNGELVAGNRGGLFACSCATGPALEGATIKSGMRAMQGAIDKVWIDPVTFELRYRTIDDIEKESGMASCRPKGICGSGVIDTIAELYRSGLIESNGAFTKTAMTSRLRNAPDGSKEFLLVRSEEASAGRDIVLTQKDIRQIQLAKAALSAGSKTLMEKLGITRFDQVLIGGAFGLNIDIDSAVFIGLIPPCDRERIIMVGNAAGRGAYLALIDKDRRVQAERIARQIKHVQLASESVFQQEFVKSLRFPPLAASSRDVPAPEKVV